MAPGFFLTSLWTLLEDTAVQDCVRWNATGNGFIILSIPAFEANVLPRYYKHKCVMNSTDLLRCDGIIACAKSMLARALSAELFVFARNKLETSQLRAQCSRYASFLRSLSYYAFYKNLTHPGTEYLHPLLRRDDKNSLSKLTRKPTAGSKRSPPKVWATPTAPVRRAFETPPSSTAAPDASAQTISREIKFELNYTGDAGSAAWPTTRHLPGDAQQPPAPWYTERGSGTSVPLNFDVVTDLKAGTRRFDDVTDLKAGTRRSSLHANRRRDAVVYASNDDGHGAAPEQAWLISLPRDAEASFDKMSDAAKCLLAVAECPIGDVRGVNKMLGVGSASRSGVASQSSPLRRSRDDDDKADASAVKGSTVEFRGPYVETRSSPRRHVGNGAAQRVRVS